MKNLFLAVLPTIVLITYIMYYDRYNPEPKKLCLKLFFFGCTTTVPAILLERMVPDYPMSGLQVFWYCIYGIAAIEEGVKLICTIIIAYKNRAFDEIYDGIIYCVLVSLGFATVENIMYVSSYGMEIAIMRMITAVPAHAIFAVVMGYHLGLSKAIPQKKVSHLLKAFIMPVILHGIYDFILSTEYYIPFIVFIVYVYYLYKKMFRMVKETYNIQPFR